MIGGGELEESGAEIPPARYGRKIPLTKDELRELTPQQEFRPAERKKRLWPIVVIVAAIVVVAGILGYRSLVPTEGNSPEDAFRGFVEAMNEMNASKAIEFTVDAFIDDSLKAAEVEEMEMMWAEDGAMTITIHSVEVIHRSDMGSSVRAQLDSVVEQVENLWKVSVTDSCGLSFSITAIQGGETHDNYGSVPVLEIQSSWYLAPAVLSF